MPSIVAALAPDGSFWMDVAIAHHRLNLMVDTGFVDPLNRVGVALEPMLYDALHGVGLVRREQRRHGHDASGHRYEVLTGIVDAQLVDPVSRAVVGPLVRVRALRGVPGVPSRVGVAFFHRLAGCRVIWELDQRTWCIEYP